MLAGKHFEVPPCSWAGASYPWQDLSMGAAHDEIWKCYQDTIRAHAKVLRTFKGRLGQHKTTQYPAA